MYLSGCDPTHYRKPLMSYGWRPGMSDTSYNSQRSPLQRTSQPKCPSHRGSGVHRLPGVGWRPISETSLPNRIARCSCCCWEQAKPPFGKKLPVFVLSNALGLFCLLVFKGLPKSGFLFFFFPSAKFLLSPSRLIPNPYRDGFKILNEHCWCLLSVP